MNARRFDIAVIGGGLVGAAMAYGMRELGARLVMLDEGDRALRASRGNFGLIWVQGKGLGLPPYGGWTQRSAREWPRLADDLRRLTGIDVALRQSGGVHLCLSRHELDVRAAKLRASQEQPGFDTYTVDVLDHAALKQRLPALGPGVVGGTFCGLDGDCNPLRLLHALHGALEQSQCRYWPNAIVAGIEPRAGHFELRTGAGIVAAERIVLAAGLGNARLAPLAGLVAPVRPNKGQILVLERMQPFLPLPLETIRQTDDGTVMIGDSQQDAGADETHDPAVLAEPWEGRVRNLQITDVEIEEPVRCEDRDIAHMVDNSHHGNAR